MPDGRGLAGQPHRFGGLCPDALEQALHARRFGRVAKVP
jgi:hypothetical protein